MPNSRHTKHLNTNLQNTGHGHQMVEERTPKHQTHSKETLSPNTNSLLCHFAIQRMLSIEFYFLLNSLPCIPSQDMSKRNALVLSFSSLNLNLEVGRGSNWMSLPHWRTFLAAQMSYHKVIKTDQIERFMLVAKFSHLLYPRELRKHAFDLIWFYAP